MRRLREPANGLTHLAGALLAVAALTTLLRLAADAGTARHVVAYAVFGVSLVALYTASALYHCLPLSARGVARLRRVDHMMIYVLIAGTYTPFGMLVLEGTLAVVVLCIVWGGALAGVVMKLVWIDAPKWLVAVAYVALGWVAIATMPQLGSRLGLGALVLLIGGGAAYTAGAVIYALGRPDPAPRVFGYHEIFHVLVILAAGAHFAAVAFFVLPSA